MQQELSSLSSGSLVPVQPQQLQAAMRAEIEAAEHLEAARRADGEAHGLAARRIAMEHELRAELEDRLKAEVDARLGGAVLAST